MKIRRERDLAEILEGVLKSHEQITASGDKVGIRNYAGRHIFQRLEAPGKGIDVIIYWFQGLSVPERSGYYPPSPDVELVGFFRVGTTKDELAQDQIDAVLQRQTEDARAGTLKWPWVMATLDD